jgi:hypothetical protein
MPRLYIDCRELSTEGDCDLLISGSEQHLLDAAMMHAVLAHEQTYGPALRERVRAAIKERGPEVSQPG